MLTFARMSYLHIDVDNNLKLLIGAKRQIIFFKVKCLNTNHYFN